MASLIALHRASKMTSVRCMSALTKPLLGNNGMVKCISSFSPILKRNHEWQPRKQMVDFGMAVRGVSSKMSVAQQRETGPLIQKATILTDSKMLEVQVQGGEQLLFPFVWLRDNCQCEKCYHQISHGRMFPLMDLDIDTQPQHVKVGTYMYIDLFI